MRARVRRNIRGYAPTTVALACAGLVVALSTPVAATASAAYAGPAAKPASDSFVYIDEAVSEVPNAVAVANDGTIVASLFDAQAVALVKGPGYVVNLSLGCSPADVAIHPDATLAWAVCPGDVHLYVINIASGQVDVASVGLSQPDDVVYLPQPDRLVIADFNRGVVVTSAAPNYQVIKEIPTPNSRPTTLAVRGDGSRGYAVTDTGRLLTIDMERETVRELTGQGANVLISSIVLSRSGTSLYATADEMEGSSSQAFLLRLDPVSGGVLQRESLTFTSPGFTSMGLAAGHRSLSVATGLYVDIGGNPTGTFDVALDDRGGLGELSAVMPVSYAASGVARSADGRSIAFGITNNRVAGVVVDDPPYPPSITLNGTLTKGRLSLAGATISLPPGTPLTVHVRDATRTKAPFVVQRVTAAVDARGDFRWSGKSSLKRLQVFVTGPECASPTIRVVAK